MTDELKLRSVDIGRDAVALAKMWNDSDSQWPGSFTGGVPMTAESVTRWYREEDALDVMVWANGDGEIAGYCSLQKESDEENVGYVHVLNVHPAYQKQSLGRRFLTAAVERCVKLGMHRLDLHTWPGNLKAVPLYKKTGFFWVPDTDVFMMNFVPAALQSPCAEAYFAKHNWYQTLDRQLEQKEDDERWHGMKVFTYRWQEGEDALTVWADREGRAITAMETNEFYAAAIPESVSPAKGTEVAMRWEVRNKRDTPLLVSLIARGSEHLKLDYRSVMQVAPGETLTRSAQVAVDAKMPKTRSDRVTPKIESLLLIDGKLLELGTGLRPEPAVVVEMIPRQIQVAPGVHCRVNVQFRNALDVPVKARVHLVAPEGLEIDRDEAEVALGARSQSGIPVKAKAAEPGAYSILALVDFQEGDKRGRSSPQELVIMAAYPGQAMAYELEDEILVISGQFSYRVRRDGGTLVWRNLAADEYTGQMAGELGPPFDPPEFHPQKAKLILGRDDQGVVVTSEHVSKRFPGLVFYRDLHFNGGSLVRVVHRTMNNGDIDHEPEYRIFIGRWGGHEQALTLPLRSGLLHAPMRSFPAGDEDVPRDPQAYAESWLAVQSRLATTGAIWSQGYDEVRCHWGTSLRKARYACPAHGWAEKFDLWLYVGSGGWEAVQEAYALLSGTPRASLLKDIGPITRVDFEPSVPLLQSGESSPTVRIEHRRQRKLDGELVLTPPEGWSVQPGDAKFAGVDREHSLSTPVALTYGGGNPRPGAYELRLALSTQLSDTVHRLPFVVVGDGRDVATKKRTADREQIWEIDNGRTCLTVAPGHSGAVVGWKTPGEAEGPNHLDTDFPSPSAHGWMAPWYGGIWPVAWDPQEQYPGKLHTEAFTAETVQMRDAQGVAWRGVRLSAALERDRVRGLCITVDYLTIGGSPLLKAIFRVENPTKAHRRLRGGFTSFWALDGDSTRAVLRSEDWESKRTSLMDDWIQAGNWATLTNPATGRTVIAVCRRPEVILADEGISSHSLDVRGMIDVPPDGTALRVAYFVMADALEDAVAFKCLSGLQD